MRRFLRISTESPRLPRLTRFGASLRPMEQNEGTDQHGRRAPPPQPSDKAGRPSQERTAGTRPLAPNGARAGQIEPEGKA